MVKEDNYNPKYSQKEFYWGIKPHKLVIESIKYLPPSTKVLDLGCGEGKNSFYLAKKGFDVSSIDISEVGIKKLQDFAKKEKLKIKAEVCGANSFLDVCEEFDAIFCMNVLQFIDQKNIVSIINKINSKTKSKGLNVVASFVAETEKQKQIVMSRGRYLFDEGELKKIYKDWKILFYEEKLGDWETHGELRHRHFKVKLIAQKP